MDAAAKRPKLEPEEVPQRNAAAVQLNTPSQATEDSKAPNSIKQEDVTATSASPLTESAGPAVQAQAKAEPPSVHPGVVHCPVFRPTIEEFAQPLQYIEQIRPEAEGFGICKIIPPEGWDPPFPLADAAFKFTTRVQRTHLLYDRDQPNIFIRALQRHLAGENVVIAPWPAIAGFEIDLEVLYHVVEDLGGCDTVGEQNLWEEVAAHLKVPLLAAHDPVRLQAIYYKYLVTFALLSEEERANLMSAARDEPADTNDDFGFGYGQQYSLGGFRRVADSFKAAWYPDHDPTPAEIERDYWRIVEGQRHVSVLYGSDIDVTTHGSGFPTAFDEPYSKFGWNLNVLPGLPESVLKHADGISVEDNYLYSINYMHFGAGKRWYGCPSSHARQFEASFRRRLPNAFAHNPHLLHDIVTQLSPGKLAEDGVLITTCVQEPRDFIVTFPQSYHGGFSNGFNCGEAVNFASPDWLPFGFKAMQDYHAQRRPVSIDQEKLLCEIAQKESQQAVLQKVLPLLQHMRASEKKNRQLLEQIGVTKSTDLDDLLVARPDLLDTRTDKVNAEATGAHANGSAFATMAKPMSLHSGGSTASKMNMKMRMRAKLATTAITCGRCRRICFASFLWSQKPIPKDPDDAWSHVDAERDELVGHFACATCSLEAIDEWDGSQHGLRKRIGPLAMQHLPGTCILELLERRQRCPTCRSEIHSAHPSFTLRGLAHEQRLREDLPVPSSEEIQAIDRQLLQQREQALSMQRQLRGWLQWLKNDDKGRILTGVLCGYVLIGIDHNDLSLFDMVVVLAATICMLSHAFPITT
ncbi:uncharacterized protein MONBRDRAFT_33502 [Monosiga brevicollis MX1]|uniref:[Histone H3]-trimethyl-L-lysine(4) demethylase n=1 Tax=Monosiga brevicollis TaxID=81824 RepID=A9V5R2_MONBE|nr:uncharacterized protein MONBRDRAFT_33502 [Monosiga brevicollis MX1]EDQ87085.1 predicted protein [Monosiga brevicollis MX1]|eukprot:XP_001748028.1 hypothetical protein [Monosiga brevicollis MX1]